MNGRWREGLFLVTLGYFVAAFAGAAALELAYKHADLGQIPKAIWVLAGPLIGLLSGHGLAYFIVATILVIPCFTAAFVAEKTRRIAFLLLGICTWLVVGISMI